MVRTIVVGDGPGGLSAALFLAKNGQDVTVYAQDRTPVHYALLFNYLGVREIPGSEFQRIARAQVREHGAEIRDAEVTEVERNGDGFVVHTDDGGRDRADYLVFAGGRPCRKLADELGAEKDDGAVAVDTQYRTSLDRVYAVGRLARPERSQAIISAGAGATAALDILSREEGADFHDWDTPPDDS